MRTTPKPEPKTGSPQGSLGRTWLIATAAIVLLIGVAIVLALALARTL